jgi:hypothetical protein
LFEQLGLDGSEAAIEQFISLHKPIPGNVPLHEADFWTPAQASMLREAVTEDADWAEVVDHLDAMLR